MTSHEKREYRATRKRDNNACIFCGNPRTEVHHIIYRSHGGKTDKRNMVCLCKHHHEIVHSDERKWREYLLDRMRGHYGMINKKDLVHRNKWEVAFSE